MLDEQEIYQRIRTLLTEMFEIDPFKVTAEARLYDDLDIDSIDAVDLLVKLKELTGRRIEAQEFKQVRTVADVVVAVQRVLAEAPQTPSA